MSLVMKLCEITLDRFWSAETSGPWGVLLDIVSLLTVLWSSDRQEAGDSGFPRYSGCRRQKRSTLLIGGWRLISTFFVFLLFPRVHY